MICINCGINVEESNYCPECGTKLELEDINLIKKTKGTVTITRIKQFKGTLISFQAYLDDKYIGSLNSNQTISIETTLGKHIVKLKSIDKTIEQEITLDEHQDDVVIECDCKMGLLTGRPNITNIQYK